MPLNAGKSKAKKCRHCKAEFVPARSFQTACSVQCALEVVKAKKAKEHRQIERKERAERLDARRRLKTKSEWLRECQIVFNQFIRLRDQLAGHACISSGRPLDWNGNAVDAGHYRSVGAAPHLRFDERNCHAQSKQDNRYLSGAAVDYRLGLIQRIGLEAVEMLESDNEPKRYTIDDLRAIKEEYRAKVRELKKQHDVS